MSLENRSICQLMKKGDWTAIEKTIGPAMHRLICAKSVSIYAQHAAIEPESNVQLTP